MSVNAGAASSTITLYDGTSTAGTKLGTFGAVTPISFDNLSIAFSVGLFAVVVGTADIIVRYV